MKGGRGKLKGSTPLPALFLLSWHPPALSLYLPPTVIETDVACIRASTGCSRVTDDGGISCNRSSCCVVNTRQRPWSGVACDVECCRLSISHVTPVEFGICVALVLDEGK